MQLSFRALDEERPGAAWHQVVAHGWPGWKQWMLSRGGDEAPRVDDARRALRRHMPEMEALWDSLVEEAGGDDDLARFLSFWQPPAYMVSCSQAVVNDADGPMLIRNYDLDPQLNEATLLRSAWRGRRVMGMVEGLAGLADGVNEVGLAASLAFGGRVVVGKGFGIPLIVRYLLEICGDVPEAVEVLRAVPCHMSYNVTLADRSGASATVFLAPDRPAIVSDRRTATNHQIGVEWPRHGRISRTLEREQHLERMLCDPAMTHAAATRAFLGDPLFSTDYAHAIGTVYTAAYYPAAGAAALFWREGAPRRWTFQDFESGPVAHVNYTAAGSHARAARSFHEECAPGLRDRSRLAEHGRQRLASHRRTSSGLSNTLPKSSSCGDAK